MGGRVTWNVVGNNFRHTTGGHTGRCATHGKLPNHVEWSFDQAGDVTFYLDGCIARGVDDRRDLRKFGWVLESRSIRPGVLDDLKRHHAEYFDHYEAIFTHNQELLALDDRFRFCPTSGYWVVDAAVHPKSRLVSAISSGKTMCDGHRWRNEFIEKHRDRFDLFGNSYRHIPRKEVGLNEYMFSVAIENGSYATYFTEKILDCFATGTIPIYRGAPDIGDHFDVDGILVIDDDFSFDVLSPELYASKLPAVEENFERVAAYHCAEDWIYRRYRSAYGF
jgi:hypothetical protein